MTLLARAMYHNESEAPNELAFRKGEILTVLNQTPPGLAGWWVCNVRGKIGLAPGNRLQLLGVVQPTPEMRKEVSSTTREDPVSVYDTLPTPTPSEERRLPNHNLPQPPDMSRCSSYYSDVQSTTDSVYQVPDDDNVYQTPALECDVYSVPPDRSLDDDAYQVPPHHGFHLDTAPGGDPHSNRSSGISSMTYQVPPTPLSPNNHALPPGSKENLATTPDSQFEDYDATLSSQRLRPSMTSTPVKLGSRDSSLSATSGPSDYYNMDDSVPSPLTKGDFQKLRHSSASSMRSLDYTDMPNLPDQRLSLSRESALELLEKVKSSTETNSGKLFKFISSKWKSVASLVVNVGAIRSTSEALARDVDEFIRFSYSVLAGANACADTALPKKIWKHLKPLEENHKTMRAALQALAGLGWRPEDIARLAQVPETDHLNTVVTSIRSISIDMRSLSVTTIGNATLLFPEKVKANPASSSLAPRPLGDQSRLTAPSVDWSAADSVDYLEMTTKRLSLQSQTLSREEKESLKWYSAQIESGVDILNQATDSLFKSIEKCQPPNVFVQHSKFVVMSAQKLVYVGDSIGRSLKHKALAHEILSNASKMCEILKSVVSTTKVAAEKHPSPKAIQEMMDAVVKVSSSASRLQLIVANSANAVL